MGFYARWLVPRLIDLAMRNAHLAEYRRRTVPLARGRVLEIGVGSGRNLPLYGDGVTELFAIDPSSELLHLARRRPGGSRPLLARASAEVLPFPSGSFDTVVVTWTLCSIPDPVRALRETRRVLAPQGRLLFVEHGLSPDRGVRQWQDALTPCWKRIGGGCHLNRKMDDLIRAAGFELGALRTGYMKGLRPMTFMYQGWARPETLAARPSR